MTKEVEKEADPDSNSWETHVKSVSERLHQLYTSTVKPLEEKYKYDHFKPSWFEESIQNKRPFVTFFGPWSSGKSTFINHLLQSNYLWTGPQPTTAEFTVILYGEEVGPLDGRVIVNSKDLPFKGLTEFGESFLSNFQGYQINHELLKSVILVDTPGVLESVKDIHQRKYDYVKVCKWFADRSDLIFVIFDPTKLDNGIEMRMLFKHAFKGKESKLRIILNKADTINTQELMRVYGALFWNLSNMIDTTEPPRVYVGSFWDQPYKEGTFHLLFTEEKTDLIHELTTLVPAQALDKKIASLIKRAKDVFVHSIIIGVMRSRLPKLFGKDKAKKQAIENLQRTYENVAAEFKLNWQDFPPIQDYKDFLSKNELESFPDIEKVRKEGLITNIRNLIDTVLPSMIRPVKNVPIRDPRNKEGIQMLADQYKQQILNQFQGKAGQLGSSDLVQSALRPSALADLSAQDFKNMNNNNNDATSTSSSSPISNNPMMMQMMQMMMQQMMSGNQGQFPNMTNTQPSQQQNTMQQ